MRIGDLVKIEDIGQPALLIHVYGDEVDLELCGERFLLPAELVASVDADEDAA